jgi:orotidine-5'-phosphate decarboxylase
VALDFGRLNEAVEFARPLADLVGMFKINIHLFSSAGPEAVRKIAALGPGVFLDLKFHDIPNTVAGAIAEAAALPGVELLNVHATGGAKMMRAAADALAKTANVQNRPKLIGVTVLTSLDAAELRQIGISGVPGVTVVKLARLAQKSGLDGVVASPQEIKAIRKACGKDFLIVTPGVRPALVDRPRDTNARADDQARVATPGEAIRAGADYLVVGRPITAASDSRAAAQTILSEMAAALSSDSGHAKARATR